jgi:hypothetical protein
MGQLKLGQPDNLYQRSFDSTRLAAQYRFFFERR